MKKRILSSLSILCLFSVVILVVLIAKKTNVTLDNYMIFGEKIGQNEYEDLFMSKVDSKLIRTSDSTFTSNEVESSLFLKMLHDNVSKKIDGKMVCIGDVIKKSNYVSLYVGNVDLLNKIRFDSAMKKATYDLEVLERQIDIISFNIYQIIEEIKIYNEYCNIVVLSNYFPYYDLNAIQLSELKEVFLKLNQSIFDVCQETMVSYTDIALLGTTDYLNETAYTINDKGHQYLSDKIYQCAINKKC